MNKDTVEVSLFTIGVQVLLDLGFAAQVGDIFLNGLLLHALLDLRLEFLE